jgi:hypothetical protein
VRVLRVASCAVTAAILASCSRGEPEPRPVPLSPNLEQTFSSSFANAEAGFTLAIPQSWSGRYRVNEFAGPIAQRRLPHAAHVIEFVHVPRNPDGEPQALLTISVFSHDEWTSVIAERRPLPGEVIATTPDAVWVASLPGSIPYPPGSPDAASFDAMHLTLEQVKSAFTLR